MVEGDHPRLLTQYARAERLGVEARGAFKRRVDRACDKEFAEIIVISDKEFAETIVIRDKEFAEAMGVASIVPVMACACVTTTWLLHDHCVVAA